MVSSVLNIIDRHTAKKLDLVTATFGVFFSDFLVFVLPISGFAFFKVVAFFKRNIDPIKWLLYNGNLLGDNKRRNDRPDPSRPPHFVGRYGCVHSFLSARRRAFSSFRFRFRDISRTFQGVSETALVISAKVGVFC